MIALVITHYSLINQQTNEIVAFEVKQVTEAGNSNQMEKLSFTKEANEVKQKWICVNQSTTDRHTGIHKYMRKEESKITHQFDVWHFVKNIKKRLQKLVKTNCVKIYRNAQNLYQIIFGRSVELAKGMKNCSVRNG